MSGEVTWGDLVAQARDAENGDPRYCRDSGPHDLCCLLPVAHRGRHLGFSARTSAVTWSAKRVRP